MAGTAVSESKAHATDDRSKEEPMFKKYACLLPVCLVSFSIMLRADAPLKSALSLDTEQARKVDTIEAKYRPVFASKRQEHNSEDRKLRRARIANDSQQIAAQEKIVARLSGELQEIRMKEDDEIRR